MGAEVRGEGRRSCSGARGAVSGTISCLTGGVFAVNAVTRKGGGGSCLPSLLLLRMTAVVVVVVVVVVDVVMVLLLLLCEGRGCCQQISQQGCARVGVGTKGSVCSESLQHELACRLHEHGQMLAQGLGNVAGLLGTAAAVSGAGAGAAAMW